MKDEGRHGNGALFEAITRLVDPSDVGQWMLQPNAAFDGSNLREAARRK
jgi:hypothetical protein